MLKTKGIYSNGMVLQRNTTNCIFGIADPETSVNLSFAGKDFSTNSDSSGNWKIEFECQEAGGPYQLKLSSKTDSLVFDDVFVGEVWLLSGQSNAQLPMERMKYSYPQEFKLPKNNNIRMITIPISWNFEGEQDSVENPVWIPASPETLGQMSGTGYFFAKKLSEELNVPVGIINASQGGSPIESWLSKTALKEVDAKVALAELAKWENPEAVKAKQESLKKNQDEWDLNLNQTDKGNITNWEKLSWSEISQSWNNAVIPGVIEDFESAGVVWFKKEITLTAKQVENFNSQKTHIWFGTIVDADKIYVNGVQVGVTYYCYPPRRYVIPSGTLVEGKNTITVRVQKNSKFGKIRFYTEKPYCIFTDNLSPSPVAFRNVEHQASVDPSAMSEKSEMILLDGMWKMATGTVVEDAPEGMFFEWVPTALYNAMLSPCFNYAIKGALWYQGESNASRFDEYKKLLCKLILQWRQKFVYAPSDMPVVVVQLPNWSDGHNEKSSCIKSEWASLRQEQLLATELAGNAGLAVTIDAGEWNDLHPEKKYTTGTRSALEALRIGYKKDISPAPKAIYTERRGKDFVVQFDCKDCFLVSYDKDSEDFIPGFSFTYEEEGELKVVEIGGRIISGNEVAIPVPAVNGTLKEVRYLWADSPNPVGLYSNKGLPAAPFRADVP